MHSDYYFGILGFSWQEKVLERMRLIVSADLKADVSTKLVNALYDIYIVNGDKNMSKEDLADLSGVDVKMAQAFLVALQDAAIKGEIAYKYYDPSTIKAGESKKSDLLTPKPLKDLRTAGIIAAVLAGGFLLVKIMDMNPFRKA